MVAKGQVLRDSEDMTTNSLGGAALWVYHLRILTRCLS